MPHPAFLAALEADRDELNQLFKLRSLQGAPLDPAAFKEHLLARVEPVVAAVAEHFPERARVATKELYQVSLELFGAGYWAEQSRLPELTQLWQNVLPQLGHLVAREPERVSGSLSNALVNLASQPVRLDQWLGELAMIGPACEDVTQLLQVSSVLAWRAGMALLRKSSLRLLKSLPLPLACRALDCPPPNPEEWTRVLSRLQEDRWYNPASEKDASERSLREAARVAEYRGLGGQLMDLPIVFLHDGQLHLTDRSNSWLIEVDCFGCVLQAAADSVKPNFDRPAAGLSKVTANGTVRWRTHDQRYEARLPYLAASNSQAFDGQTLAVTLPTSFHVYLLALN